MNKYNHIGLLNRSVHLRHALESHRSRAPSARRPFYAGKVHDVEEIFCNEREVGEGLRASGIRRDDVFITTKVWPDHLASTAFERATKESLVKLRLPAMPRPPQGEDCAPNVCYR
jgi:hypothetical protein